MRPPRSGAQRAMVPDERSGPGPNGVRLRASAQLHRELRHEMRRATLAGLVGGPLMAVVLLVHEVAWLIVAGYAATFLEALRG